MAECDIAAWLNKLGLNEYTEKFLFAGYSSLQQCVSLSKADLSAIGITKLGHVNRLFRDLQRMKAEGEIESSSPPSCSSPLHKSSTDVTCSPLSGQHQDAPTKLWSNPLRRLASFLMHTKSATPSAVVPQRRLSPELKFDENYVDSTAPPKPFQRRWSFHKTISKNKLFRQHSMRTSKEKVTSGTLATYTHRHNIIDN